MLQLVCTVRGSNKRRSSPVIVRVSDVNDNAPRFTNKTYSTTISEVFFYNAVINGLIDVIVL